MEKKHLLRSVLFVVILISNIGCDQISKSIVRSKIVEDEQISMISDRVILTRVENSGAFLSLGDALPLPLRFILLVLVPIVVLGCAFIYAIKNKSMSDLSRTGVCFLIGGGIGNIYDRVLHGSVTDFLHIDFVLFRTGIFNMADVSIMIGVILVLLSSFRKEIHPVN